MNRTASVTFDETKMLPRGFHKSLNGYLHLTDERKYIRYIDFFTLEEKDYAVSAEKPNQ